MSSLFKKLLVIVGCVLVSGCSSSQNIPSKLPPLVEQPALDESPILTKESLMQAQGEDAAKAIKQYEKTGYALVVETSQKILFPFNVLTPTVNCSPLHTCDLKFEMGEKITGVFPGDTSRWLFEEAISGEGLNQQMHVIFKPKDYDISTNAIITTTKRTYHINLNSKKDVVVKQIAFYYPEDFEAEWEAIQKESILNKKFQQKQENDQRDFWSINSLDFKYKIKTPFFSEKPLWTPLHVFNDGVHVYIEMPKQSETISLPVLFVIGKDGQKELVNYRVKSPYYIVDELFQKAVLELKSGQDEQSVTLTYAP